MTFESILLAIESRMSQWPDAPVAYDGISYPKYDEENPDAPQNDLPIVQAIWNKDPWVRLTINHGDSRTAYIGDGPKARRTGLVQCQIFTPENRGSRPAALLADSIAEHLQYYQDGQLSTQAASVRRIGPDDGWYMYLASVPFAAG